MQLFTEMKDDVAFLRKMYAVVGATKKYLEETQIVEIYKKKADVSQLRDKLIKVDESITEDEKKKNAEILKEIKAANIEQSKQNLSEIVKTAFFTYPEETVKLAHEFIILESGEDYPHGIDLLNVMLNMFTNEDIINFFSSSGLMNPMKSKK